MAALSLVVMLLAGGWCLWPPLPLPAVAGCLLIPVVVEAGLAWGFGVYGVCSVLAFCWCQTGRRSCFTRCSLGTTRCCTLPWGGFKAGCCAMEPSFWCSTRPQCWRCSSLSMCWESPPLRAFPFWGPGARTRASGAGQPGVPPLRLCHGRADRPIPAALPRPAGQAAAGQVKDMGRLRPAFSRLLF